MWIFLCVLALIIAIDDPAAFDDSPGILTRRDPVYPKTARTFDFKGTVNVAALVDETGLVVDAFVLQSSASHELNMAALTAAMAVKGRPSIVEVIVSARDV